MIPLQKILSQRDDIEVGRDGNKSGDYIRSRIVIILMNTTSNL
jgi:hypothetical protein